MEHIKNKINRNECVQLGTLIFRWFNKWVDENGVEHPSVNSSKGEKRYPHMYEYICENWDCNATPMNDLLDEHPTIKEAHSEWYEEIK